MKLQLWVLKVWSVRRFCSGTNSRSVALLRYELAVVPGGRV